MSIHSHVDPPAFNSLRRTGHERAFTVSQKTTQTAGTGRLTLPLRTVTVRRTRAGTARRINCCSATWGIKSWRCLIATRMFRQSSGRTL